MCAMLLYNYTSGYAPRGRFEAISLGRLVITSPKNS